MLVRDAQREVRSVYLGGAVGQLVCGVLWAISAALATWGSRRQAILFLALGGVFIFPITTLLLRLMGRKSALDRQNPLIGLAMQIAFTVPLSIPLVAAASLHNVNWFYPAFMVVVGAHYLPFIFLYGMWEFAVLAALLLGGGIALGMRMPHDFVPGGWYTAAALLLFAGYAAVTNARRERAGAST
jgi:uncharacterized protein DUF7010